MPVAQPFKALGRGNGFPFCLNKVNVSGFDYWTTISGTNKDNYTGFNQESINEDLILAMKFYWNFYSISGFIKTRTNISNNPKNYDLIGPFVFDTDPYKRVCGGDGPSIVKVDEISEVGNLPWRSRVLLNAKMFARLYNGDVNNESNFVGYGFAIPWTYDSFGILGAAVSLSSYTNASNSSYYDYEYGYATIGDYHFVSFAYVDESVNITSANVSAADMFAKYSWVNTIGNTGSGDVKIEDLDFYTY